MICPETCTQDFLISSTKVVIGCIIALVNDHTIPWILSQSWMFLLGLGVGECWMNFVPETEPETHFKYCHLRSVFLLVILIRSNNWRNRSVFILFSKRMCVCVCVKQQFNLYNNDCVANQFRFIIAIKGRDSYRIARDTRIACVQW